MIRIVKAVLCLLVFGVLFSGCMQNATKLNANSLSSSAAGVPNSPRIVFESTDCNIGSIGPMTEHDNCVFKFRNGGTNTLKITEMQRQRGCPYRTLSISKKTLAPGEKAELYASYTSSQMLGAFKDEIYISTNDKSNPKVTLFISGIVEDKVYYEPRHIRLSLDKENAGCPQIVITGLDGKQFSVKGIVVKGNGLAISNDPLKKSQGFAFQPVANMGQLRKKPSGEIIITLDHPQCGYIVIPFEALPEFELVPNSLVVAKAVAKEPVVRNVKVLNHYKQPFEIKSVVSSNGIMKIMEQKAITNGWLLTIQITPPEKTKESFEDVLTLHTVDGRDIAINCQGFYKR